MTEHIEEELPEVNIEHKSVCTIIKEELHEPKWVVLVFACLLTFGGSYIMDFPGAFGSGDESTIEQAFKEAGKVYTQSMNQLLYSVYSWPNTVLAIVGGLLIDKYLGLRRALLLFTFLVLCGAALFYVGVVATSFPLILCARVLYGLGGESLSVAQSAFVARWFKTGRGMSLAFGVSISTSRIGSSLNFILSPLLAGRYGVATASLAGVLACAASLIACIVLVAADVYAVRTGYIKEEGHEEEEETALLGAEREEEEEEEAAQSKSACCDSLWRLPTTFWLLSVICVCAYMSIYPFIGIARIFFERKYACSPEYAGQIISTYQITAAVCSPLVGLFVDTMGMNTVWLLLACLAFGIIHALFMATALPAVVLMVAMGFFYSFLVSGLWPSIPLAVPGNYLGFAYGTMTSCQNIGFAFFPLLIGYTLDQYTHHPGANSGDHTGSSGSGSSFFSASSSWESGSSSSSFSGSGESSSLPTLEGFMTTEVMFIVAAGIGVLASFALIAEDGRNGGFLSASIARRVRIISGQQEDEDRRSLLQGIIPESQRTPLRPAAVEDSRADV
ncbi:Major Facilitator Superfamily, putative [Angomonas deanei]|uniref:Lysosomal dipeptide transporter MFSD1 n=1 Tax=Angomonas deanei TaxID=59799 RepID=A0A7G2CBQ2_9TRYP|nr:Major Facilitator Superfamily, putative [Angomonas deanei]